MVRLGKLVVSGLLCFVLVGCVSTDVVNNVNAREIETEETMSTDEKIIAEYCTKNNLPTAYSLEDKYTCSDGSVGYNILIGEDGYSIRCNKSGGLLDLPEFEVSASDQMLEYLTSFEYKLLSRALEDYLREWHIVEFAKIISYDYNSVTIDISGGVQKLLIRPWEEADESVLPMARSSILTLTYYQYKRDSGLWYGNFPEKQVSYKDYGWYHEEDTGEYVCTTYSGTILSAPWDLEWECPVYLKELTEEAVHHKLAMYGGTLRSECYSITKASADGVTVVGDNGDVIDIQDGLKNTLVWEAKEYQEAVDTIVRWLVGQEFRGEVTVADSNHGFELSFDGVPAFEAVYTEGDIYFIDYSAY